MKNLLKKTMVVPRYVERFRCVGSECPETCCEGWNISIDRRTYASYKTSTDPVLIPLFREHLQRNRTADTEDKFAKIKFEYGSKRCGFQSDCGTCEIHARLGEDALSDSCYNYPRNTSVIDGKYEQALSLSCPEAARLALLSADAFEFVAEDLTIRSNKLAKVSTDSGFDEEGMYETRNWCMQLLQTVELDLTDRLAILGLLCDQLEVLIRERRQAELPLVLNQMTQLVESGALLESVAALPHDDLLQVQLFASLFCGNAPSPYFPRQLHVFATVARGLGAGVVGKIDSETMAGNYSFGREFVLTNDDLNAVLQRYLLNEVFSSLFPWSYDSPYQHYQRLIVCFGIIRLMLAGYAAAHQRAPTAAEAADVIQVFCRLYAHNAEFTSGVEGLLNRCGWNTMSKLFAVLK